jgi:hypothetical protein
MQIFSRGILPLQSLPPWLRFPSAIRYEELKLTMTSDEEKTHARVTEGFHMGKESDFDNAFNYIQSINTADLDTESVDFKELRRKVDYRIMPVMFLCYTMQFLDKVNINVSFPFIQSIHVPTERIQYAAVMGLNKDLKLVGNNFSNASTAFFIAYLISEVPNGKPIPT